MARQRKTDGSRYETRERWAATFARLVVSIASGKAQLTVLLLAALFTLWQLYVFAWQPLRAPADLPAGLASVRAQIDTASLAKIRDARADRLQHTPNLFSNADQYFIISPVTTR